MKPTDELMEEHRVIERMLRIIEKASDQIEEGGDADKELFVGAADFFKNFADRCHHGKEERLLFEKMIERGVSGEVGPIAVMMREHQDGREHVKRIAELSSGKIDRKTAKDLVRHSKGYVNLLSQHIQKEDNILYPMANQILTGEDQEELGKGFEKVEKEIMGPGAHERYHEMIEQFEKKYA